MPRDKKSTVHAAAQENASKRRTQPLRPTSATPGRPSSTTPGRQLSSTPQAKINSASASKAANSTPRSSARPATTRSLSTPLVRSLSYRGPRVKDRRWSANDKSPVSTYQDDYKSPEELSHKLQSLNLETSTTALAVHNTDFNPCTTYRESFRWRKSGKGSPTVTPSSPLSDNGSDAGNGEAGTRVALGNSSKRTVYRQTSVDSVDTPIRHKPANDNNGREAVAPSPSGGKGNRFRIGGSDLFSVLKHEQTASKGPSRNGLVPVKRNGDVSVNRSTAASRTTGSQSHASSHVIPSGEANPTSPSTAASPGVTARQARAAQLQSSVGSSPFAYGSDSGTWV
ncbi:hypothetical protein BaRGS_00000027 [Batillaria attramentaria]|uniref:Uncharacterized protein n=1 Tax=Batillaria attramentaria TaxID=370345 RepID=A0ABD0MB01_9CAEN